MHPCSVLFNLVLWQNCSTGPDGERGEGRTGAVSESGSEVVRQKNKQEPSEKEMESVVTASGSCGKRKLLRVGSETRESK